VRPGLSETHKGGYSFTVYDQKGGLAWAKSKGLRCSPCLKGGLHEMSKKTRVGMHSRTAIRFYKIHTPLTEAVLPDNGNYKTIVSLCYQLL
jgi:hypothetical protein